MYAPSPLVLPLSYESSRGQVKGGVRIVTQSRRGKANATAAAAAAGGDGDGGAGWLTSVADWSITLRGRAEMERTTRFSFRRKGSKNKDKEARERDATIDFDYDTLSYLRSVRGRSSAGIITLFCTVFITKAVAGV